MGARTSTSTSASSSPSASTPASSISAISRASSSKKTPFPMSDIRVNLKDHYSSKVYTTSSKITGDVTITTKREVRFDSIQILLLGQTKTSFEGMGVPQEVSHVFLKMIMPVPESTYPIPRVLESGRTYTIPFNFVIPRQLTINACNHEVSDQLQEHHVLLPPSVGGWQRDDMAPKMAKVEYTVKARVLRDDGVSSKKIRIMEASEPIQVLPATPQQPPLDITDKDKLYRMSKTKILRRNLLSTKLGRLTAEAVQPSPAVLSPDGRRVMSHPMAHIKLTFEPDSPRTLPPTITSVSAKLTSHTYFSSGTISSFPNIGEWNLPYLLDRRGQFFSSVPLPAVTLAEQPAWTPTTSSPPITRRDSGYCSSSSDEAVTTSRSSRSSSESILKLPVSPSDRKREKQKKKRNSTDSTTLTPQPQTHTTTLQIPLSLPTDKKTFVPTFHSCLASRVYTVQLTMHTSTRGASNTVSLVVPLQIAVEGFTGEALCGCSCGSLRALPSFEEAEADAHLRPRVLQVPAEGLSCGDGGGARQGMASWMMAPGSVPPPVVPLGDNNNNNIWMQMQMAPVGEERPPEYGEPGYRRRID
ncbi:hypothetical protein C8A03DRAFT_18487 [Achaetomium macrosporum]|uniref:Bul1 C-terminal domain-containing protein n=1 Tax=Achaetomium macrosporum TaxID=79813 RepID=A0AAN7C454_9PEZI|nr:hypothetical protein C8A03DRAFT_18487 [Achaetomium macrosporum]